MRRRSRLPTPSNVRNNKTAQEDVPIEGARLEALRAHAKRSVAASHAAAAAPPKAPWSEAATALLSICFFVALCVMGFWLEGDLESARKRQAGDCAFEEAVAGYVWPALTLPGEGLNGWRPIVASAAAVAKRLGYGLVLPCVADSELACCVDASAPAGPWLRGLVDAKKIEDTAENRAAYRSMLYKTPGLSEYVSGAAPRQVARRARGAGRPPAADRRA